MSRGLEPVTELGQARRGVCSLCGTVGMLTETHVPPGSAGNTDSASRLCKETDDDGVVCFVKGREKLGGTRFYSQCHRCNTGIVSRYDAEWPLWADDILGCLDGLGRRVPDAGFPMILPRRRPGAFVRSVLAGMFALTPTTRQGWPDVADALRTGAPVDDPRDLHLLMHLYSGPHRIVSSGMGRATSSTLVPGGGSLESILGEIAWPPLHFVLVHRSDLDAWPCKSDVTAWLRDDWRATRDVALLLKLLTSDQLFSLEFGRSASA